mmetsp:Transcript_7474/g.10485  ORF Transcript_7474/g.10485 Transcript_7474/m.10485 type:complete len:382 (-) Transcript_7474:60-1205(-)
MADFFRLRGSLNDAFAKYFELAQAASDNCLKEVKAVTKIQSVYRASKVRERWHELLRCCLLIQRVARGWLARSRSEALLEESVKKADMIFFHHCASVVQKFFRGWWSRKRLHDYHGRKAYLKSIEKRGEWTVDVLRRAHEMQQEQSRAQEEANMRSEFDKLAGELHHLVSTRSIAGVYNPPYNDTLPRAFDKPIEQHLRDSCAVRLPKSLRRPQHRLPMLSASPRAAQGASQPVGPPQELPDRASHHSRTASVGRMQKIQGPFRSKEQIEVANVKARNQFGSVQASSSYDHMESDRKMQDRISKLTRVSPVDFMSPGLPPTDPPPQSVHVSVPYRERPMELRGDFVELPKIRDKPPFFTAMPRDKDFIDYQEQPFVQSGHA